MMNRPHFRRTRRPRPTDPDPYTRLDRLDGLPGRDAAMQALLDETWVRLVGEVKVDAALAADLPAEPATVRTRYDAEWPDVLAAEGGMALGRALDLADLPVDQSGFSGWGEYDIGPETPAIVTRPQRVSGYFWLPCPVCGEHFSGADPRPRGRYAFVPDPDYPPGTGRGLCICPRCIAAGRGVNTLDAEASARWLMGRALNAAIDARWPDLAAPDLPMVRAAATAYDLGLPVPLRSDPPLYRQALAGHVGAGVA